MFAYQEGSGWVGGWVRSGGWGVEAEEEQNYSFRQNLLRSAHTALSGTDSILCARCKSILWEVPEKGAYQLEERLQQKN